MGTRISEDDLRSQITTILGERLDNFRFALLFREIKSRIKIVHADPNNRPDLNARIATSALQTIASANVLMRGGERLDEVVLVGEQERAFIFYYGRTCFVIVTGEAIGDVCYHCRWDETRHFGILPNILASGLDTEALILAHRRHVTHLTKPRMPPQSSDLPIDLKAQSVQLQTDLEHDLVLIADYPTLPELADASDERTTLANLVPGFIKHAEEFLAALRTCRFEIGDLREIVLSHTATSWSQHPNLQSLILTRDPARDAWLGILTNELLGRALFAVRRFFRSVSIPDFQGRPSMNNLFEQWYATSKDLGPWYASGVFYEPEKLWLATDHDPPRHDALSVELPDVAGSLIDKVNQFPRQISATNESIELIWLELTDNQERHSGRRLTVLFPLSNGLCVFLSTGSSRHRVFPAMQNFASRLPREWRSAKPIASANLSEHVWCENLIEPLEVSSQVSGLLFEQPLAVSWPRTMDPAFKSKLESGGVPGFLFDIAKKFAVLAFVISRESCAWEARVEFSHLLLSVIRHAADASGKGRVVCRLGAINEVQVKAATADTSGPLPRHDAGSAQSSKEQTGFEDIWNQMLPMPKRGGNDV